MLLTDKYADKIYGIITCYDRMIIQGYIPNWSHADAMTTYMKLNGIRIFDYSVFSQPLTEQVRQNAEKIAQENGIEIEFIRKLHAFRKDDRIQKIIAETGKTEGLVHIFSAMECCNTYKPWYDKTTGKTFLKFDQSKCLHYYFYFIDRELGLCYLRVPTWPPFRLQFYMNGHNLLAYKLDKKQIAYRMQDNAFLEISDIEAAQKLSDRINPEGLHKVLDAFARRYSPVPESLGLGYTWTVQQIECATDIMFRKQEFSNRFMMRSSGQRYSPSNRITSPLSLGSVLLITAPKRLVRIITSVSSVRGSNTIWVMYRSKCMTSSAASYGLKAPVMTLARSVWNGKSNIGMGHLISGKLL